MNRLAKRAAERERIQHLQAPERDCGHLTLTANHALELIGLLTRMVEKMLQNGNRYQRGHSQH